LFKRDTFDLFLREFDKPWVIHLRKIAAVLQTSALGGPTLTTRTDACVDINAIVPVPIFCCFCVSEKLHRKYSRNWTKRKPNLLFFPTRRQSPKQRRRRARRQAHHRVARPLWPRHQVVWAPSPPSDIALPPIYSL
jgi:hypothetical protein